jgi:hypothetical protein
MPLIRGRRVPLTLKHMSQMASTVTTHNLRSFHPKRPVRVPRHGSRDGVEEGGPAAAGLEFLVRGVQRCVAAGAGVDALVRVVLVELAGEGGFGALFAEDAELFYMTENVGLEQGWGCGGWPSRW